MAEKLIFQTNYSDHNYKWVDAVNPSASELESFAMTYQVPKNLALSCLEPDHMPVVHQGEHYVYIVFRSYDNRAPIHADTIHELTRKICIFIGEGFIYTIHRSEMQWYDDTIDEALTCGQPHTKDSLADFILNRALRTFETPVLALSRRIDGFEEAVFLRQKDNLALIKELFYLKRKIFLLRRLLNSSQEVTEQLPDIRTETQHHELNYYCTKLVFRYDELAELVTSLMSLNLALSDHRTNEVMRVLTLFSVFFLPVTFIAGIYGMNFEFMPELQQRYGYPVCLSLMAITIGLLYLWFRRKGWLRP